MPKATVSTNSERYDLQSCEGGYIELRRMTYGQYLQRRDMAIRMEVSDSERDNRGNRTGSTKAEMAMMQKQVALFELRHCVVDHNLTDENENKLDFTKSSILDVLDPRIGDEIGSLIDSMNRFEEVEAKN